MRHFLRAAITSLIVSSSALAAAPASAPATAAATSQPAKWFADRERDIVYGRSYGAALTFDIFRPEKPNGAAIIFVVSGGWVSVPEMLNTPLMGAFAGPLTARGYTVFAVCHACQPKFQIPEIVGNLNRAVRFIRMHAADYGVDPNRFGITGGSAGGHLSLMQAINPQLLVRTTTTALIGLHLTVPAVEPGSIAVPTKRTFIWQSARPFHPERLYDALEDLVAGTCRGRGTLWIATQHRNRLSWDSFGTNIAIGVLGPWLADLPADRWASVGQQHQTRSALEWHPEYGDRASYLSFTGADLDARELQERLDGCVLRADEAVHPLTDPFAPYLEGSTAA